MALYFKRIASTITDPYQILGSKQLTQVIQTALGLPSVASGSIAALDNQAAAIKKALNSMKDLQNPTKVNQLAERFTANYDMQNTSTSRLKNIDNGNNPTLPRSSFRTLLNASWPPSAPC